MRHDLQKRWPAAMTWAAVMALGLGGCTSTADPAKPRDELGAALSQPFQDLSLIRSEAPTVLVRAAARPYQPAESCEAIAGELAELDALLGPDVDAAPADEPSGGLAGAVVSGVASLPFRAVVRRLSGAHKRDEAVAATVLAAMVRRGFLHGEASARGCPSAKAVAASSR